MDTGSKYLNVKPNQLHEDLINVYFEALDNFFIDVPDTYDKKDKIKDAINEVKKYLARNPPEEMSHVYRNETNRIAMHLPTIPNEWSSNAWLKIYNSSLEAKKIFQDDEKKSSTDNLN